MQCCDNTMQELAGTLHAGTLAALQLRPDGFINYLQREAGFRLVRGNMWLISGIPNVQHIGSSLHSLKLALQYINLCSADLSAPALVQCTLCTLSESNARCKHCLHTGEPSRLRSADSCCMSSLVFPSTILGHIGSLQVRELHTPEDGSRGFDRPMYLLEKLAVE
jgi:hypothetical protein